MSIDPTTLNAAFKARRDTLNGGLDVNDLATFEVEDFQRGNYNALTKTYKGPTGMVIHRSVDPSTPSEWAMVTGLSKHGDEIDISDTASIDHTEWALWGQEQLSYVPGCTVDFHLAHTAYAIVRVDAEVVIPPNSALARSKRLPVDANQLTPNGTPSYAYIGVNAVPVEATKTYVFEEFNFSSQSLGLFASEAKPIVSGTVEDEVLYRRRVTLFHATVLYPGKNAIGLMIDPRSDRVFVLNRSISVECLWNA